MRLLVTLCLVALGLAAELVLAAKQNSYLIKSREITSKAEAITILRRFMSRKLQQDERCQKYAVVLNSITSAHLDQFKLAEIGLEPTDVTNQKFRNIDVETLRQLYIEGINTFMHQHIDAAMLDLVDCLSKKFRTLDAKARRYLNNADLQETLKQYNSIMSQPLNFLVDPTTAHPSLSADQLRPAVRQTMLELFNEDIGKLNRKFPVAGSSAPAPTHSVVDHPVHHEAAASSVASNDVLESAASNQVPQQQQQLQSQQPPVAVHEVLSGDEMEVLHKVIGTLHEIYNNLPVESKLGDRCPAYGKTIQADPEQLNHQFVETIVQETAKKITTLGVAADEIYKPEENIRENFLFVLTSFPKEEVGHETWIDLVDCVSQWSDEDPKVREFMDSAEQVQIFEELMKAPGGSSNQQVEPQVAQPTAQVASPR